MNRQELGILIRAVGPTLKSIIFRLAEAESGLAALKASSTSTLNALIEAEVRQQVARIPIPKDGAPGAPADISNVEKLVADRVDAAVVDLTANLHALVQDEVSKQVAQLPPAKDGSPGVSVDAEQVDRLVESQVKAAISEFPAPKDGASVTVDDLAPVIAREVGHAVDRIAPAKDGIGITGALIDQTGHLILTLSTGETKDAGIVVGKSVDQLDVVRLITEEVAKFPKPKDGADGFSLEDFRVDYDGERGFTWTFERGELRKSFPFHVPAMLYRGVFADGTAYQLNDVATWGGSAWVAKEDTTDKPGTSKAWQLMVKVGRDGREGKVGQVGPIGPKGEKGDQGQRWS